jgi:hypothetical protein
MTVGFLIDAAKVADWQHRWEREFRSQWVEHDGLFYPRGVALPDFAARRAERKVERDLRRETAVKTLLERRERRAEHMRAARARAGLESERA